MNEHAPRYWLVMPAAGGGQRMGVDQPKQYLSLLGEPLIWHSLRPFARLANLAGVIIALAAHDEVWQAPSDFKTTLRTVTGGQQRADSVLAALQALDSEAADNDWVFVHDAARPCLHADDLTALIAGVDGSVGGLLATPLADTVKRSVGAVVSETVPRDDLWRALTPQLFRYGLLREALEDIQQKCLSATDEAQAMELAGHKVLLISGRADNIKVTWPADLLLATEILRGRQKES